MDRKPEEFQSMGFFAIFRESYKLIVSWKKIFSQITLALILPFSFILLAKIQLFGYLFPEFYYNENILDAFRLESPAYNRIQSSFQSSTTSELVAFWSFQAVYIIFSLVLSLLSTSAVVYTIACIYTSKLQMITFTKVMTVVPKVWKRLMVTFLWYYLILVVCFVLGTVFVTLVAMLFVFYIPQQVFQVFLIIFILILWMCYVIGFFCLNVVWQLACVLSVLEDIYGIKAIIKSKELIKGKMWVASFTYLAIQICLFVIQRMFVKLVVVVVHKDDTQGGGLGIGSRVVYGFLCFVLFSAFTLIGLVTQTFIYFVCKSYHQENIDKSWLAVQLEEVHTGEYARVESFEV